MSNYTESMVSALLSNASWDYDQAVKYAADNNLTARSVISKIKSLGLDYTPKQKATAKSGTTVRKSDIVAAFASEINADADKLSGLAKADKAALNALISAVRDYATR